MGRKKKTQSEESRPRRKWKISDLLRNLGDCVVAIIQGKFILRLKLDKYFPQIAWTFFLFILLILLNLAVDSTLARVEANQKTLSSLEVLRNQKRYELVKLERRSTVKELLEKSGSQVTEPEKPCTALK